jgi:sensor histidine kinase regulating citrate/malate metabolism
VIRPDPLFLTYNLLKSGPDSNFGHYRFNPISHLTIIGRRHKVASDQNSINGGSSVIVSVYEKKGIIYYEVIDDGCGMDYEVKRKGFTTFFTTKGLGGTGLGLLMTKKIIQEHGGSIQLKTEPDQGTTFRICLPRKRLPKVFEPESSEPV